jgi:hypothetical protein
MFNGFSLFPSKFLPLIYSVTGFENNKYIQNEKLKILCIIHNQTYIQNAWKLQKNIIEKMECFIPLFQSERKNRVLFHFVFFIWGLRIDNICSCVHQGFQLLWNTKVIINVGWVSKSSWYWLGFQSGSHYEKKVITYCENRQVERIVGSLTWQTHTSSFSWDDTCPDPEPR